MGTVLSSRRVRAAHCMTSLQVSPGGNYVLMSYGRRHISLLRTLVEGSSIIPVHTVLEVLDGGDVFVCVYMCMYLCVYVCAYSA